MDKTDYFDKMDALVNNKLTKNLNATRHQLFNEDLTAKSLHLEDWHCWHPTLLPTKVHSATTTKTVLTTETAQTWYTDATYSLILWVPYVSTV